MLKGKFWLWVLLILICFGIKFRTPIFNFVSNLFITTDVTLTFNDEDQRIRNNFIANNNFEKLNIQLTSNIKNNPDVIIERTSTNTYDGYDKYQEELATPMVMFFNDSILKDSSGFIKTTKDSSNYVLQKDLKTILEGLEAGKDWVDIGINLDGKIEITVPNEDSPYYEDTIKFMLVNLYSTPTTPENLDERLTRISKIYKRCNIVEDIISFIENNGDYEHMCIAPEIYIKESKYFSSGGNSCILTAVYSTKEYIIKYDVFINKEKVNLADKIIEILRTDTSFTDNIGLRDTNSTYSIGKIYNSSNLIEYININDCNNNIDNQIQNIVLKSDIPVEQVAESSKSETQEEVIEETEEQVEVEESESVEENTEENVEDEDDSGGAGIIILIVMIVFLLIVVLGVIFA